MERDAALAALRRNLDSNDHSVYHPDAVLEFPQSGERFEGVGNFEPWRAVYPAGVDFEVDRFRGAGDVWTAELRLRYDGGPWKFGIDILEFRQERIARETIYFGEPWDAPEWRAKWTSA